MITLSEITDNIGRFAKVVNPNKFYNIPLKDKYIIEGFERKRDIRNPDKMETKVILSNRNNIKVRYYLSPVDVMLAK